MSFVSRRRKHYIEYKRSKAEILVLECEIRSLKREILSRVNTDEESNNYKNLIRKLNEEENVYGGYNRILVIKHIKLLDQMNFHLQSK